MSNGHEHGKCALVTDGAGLIGSHMVDLLLHEGWSMRVLDNLEPQTHRNGTPSWLAPTAEYRVADIRDRAAAAAALMDIDVVFHQAAYGGYLPEISKYVHVNSFGTALYARGQTARYPLVMSLQYPLASWATLAGFMWPASLNIALIYTLLTGQYMLALRLCLPDQHRSRKWIVVIVGRWIRFIPTSYR